MVKSIYYKKDWTLLFELKTLSSLNGDSTDLCIIQWLRCKLSHSEWFAVKCSVLDTHQVRTVHSGGGSNQTSEEFNAS